jgi:hypothetical protein
LPAAQAKFLKTPPLFCPPQAKFLKIWHLKHENSTKIIAFNRIGMGRSNKHAFALSLDQMHAHSIP